MENNGKMIDSQNWENLETELFLETLKAKAFKGPRWLFDERSMILILTRIPSVYSIMAQTETEASFYDGRTALERRHELKELKRKLIKQLPSSAS